jgi:hypothetical protein
MRNLRADIRSDQTSEAFGQLLYDACVSILTVTKGAVYICMSSSELDTCRKRSGLRVVTGRHS